MADTPAAAMPHSRAWLPGMWVDDSSGHSPTPTPSAPSDSAAQIQRDGCSCSAHIASSAMNSGAVKPTPTACTSGSCCSA